MYSYTEVSLFWSCLSAPLLLQYFTDSKYLRQASIYHLINLPSVCTLTLPLFSLDTVAPFVVIQVYTVSSLYPLTTFLYNQLKCIVPNLVVQRTNKPPCNTYVDLDHSEKSNYLLHTFNTVHVHVVSAATCCCFMPIGIVSTASTQATQDH